jgi:hypothetical protein
MDVGISYPFFYFTEFLLPLILTKRGIDHGQVLLPSFFSICTPLLSPEVIVFHSTPLEEIT